MAAVGLWLFYLAGGFASMWKRANLSVANAHTPWESIKEYLVAHGPQSAINFLLSTALFWTWWHDPTFMNKAISFVGINTDHVLPLNPITAAIYGVFSDQIMDFIVAKGAAKFQKTQ